MFENIMVFFKKLNKKNEQIEGKTNKDEAKERLHLVLMQDRANVSADFLDMMRQEIIDVIKKYIDVDEKEIDVRLTNKQNSDGTTGAPALYANIPIISIKNDKRNVKKEEKNTEAQEEKNDDSEDHTVSLEDKKEKEISNMSEENAVSNNEKVEEDSNSQTITNENKEQEKANNKKDENVTEVEEPTLENKEENKLKGCDNATTDSKNTVSKKDYLRI